MKLFCPRIGRSCCSSDKTAIKVAVSNAGRIEHIESGRVEFFYSTEEMCAKLKVILGQGQSHPGE
jgi:hypothetical protein